MMQIVKRGLYFALLFAFVGYGRFILEKPIATLSVFEHIFSAIFLVIMFVAAVFFFLEIGKNIWRGKP